MQSNILALKIAENRWHAKYQSCVIKLYTLAVLQAVNLNKQREQKNTSLETDRKAPKKSNQKEENLSLMISAIATTT